MFKYAMIIGLASLSAAVSAKSVVMLDRAGHGQVQAVQAAEMPQTSPAGAVLKSADGHYWAQATVDGRAVKFLVDTGATAVSLTPEDAIRLGFSPQTLSYDHSVQTASGLTRAAKINLSRVSVSGIAVANVEAYVIEKGLPTSLLGMTYLGRLSRFEATPQSLILRG
jgi:aspartyl protease family protein